MPLGTETLNVWAGEVIEQLMHGYVYSVEFIMDDSNTTMISATSAEIMQQR